MTTTGGEPQLTLPVSAPTLKNCAACGQEFSCGAPAPGCWCEELQVAGKVLSELQSRYADCLCRSCLTAAASSSAKRAPHTDPEPARRDDLPQNLL